MKLLNHYWLYILAGLLLAACQENHKKKEIEKTMKLYDHFIEQMNMDSLALMYTADGDLGTMAHGRDSIRNFLGTFKNVHVLSQHSVTRSIEINADSSIQKGSYKQVAVIDNKDTIKVKGDYMVNWIWNKKEGWRIKKMVTVPLK